MSLLVWTGSWRNLKDQKCHYLQLEIVLAMELETNLEVEYKEWFCSFWICSRRSLDESFGDKNCRKWGWRGTSGSRAWWNLVRQSLRRVTMLVNSEVWFLCRFAFRYAGRIGSCRRSCSFSERGALNGRNERLTLFGSLCFWFYM